jgi:putative ABC transport system permease protein
VLIVGNVALAIVLAVAATLLVRTTRAVGALDLGFLPQHVVSVGLNPDNRRYGTVEARTQFESDIVARVRRLPGVLAAGIGSRPLGEAGLSVQVQLPGQTPVRVLLDVVSPGYLQALGGRLVGGRPFGVDDLETTEPVALVNEAAARRFFGDHSPVSGVLLTGKTRRTIVGVVADVRRQGLEVDPEPTVYLPTRQFRSRFETLLIRTAGDPAAIVPAVRAILRELDPLQALSRIHVLDELLDQTKAPRRFAMQLVGAFSLLAVVLAMIGLYGVVAESVSQRVPEIGVRMALGATAGSIARMVLGQSAVTVAVGIAVGLAGAAALRGVMARFIFGVEPGDPISYITAVGLLLVAAFAASLIPARRAASIDPLQALRRE